MALRKRLASSLMAFAILLGLLPALSIPASAVSVWDGTTASGFESGNGQAGTPYEIKTASQLALLSNQVTSGAAQAGDYYTLTDNIDLNNQQWIPIGTASIPFAGHLIGNNMTISNMNVNPAGTLNPDVALGLFGRIDGGSVANLTVNGTVEASGSETNIFAGGICGFSNDSTYTNCTANVSVKSSLAGQYIYAGGFIGNSSHCTITNCAAIGNVDALTQYSVMSAGAFVNAGGFIGSGSNDTVTDSHASGTVNATAADCDINGGSYVCSAGFIGRDKQGSFANCWCDGTVSTTSKAQTISAGGFGGFLEETNLNRCSSAGNLSTVVSKDKGYLHAGGFAGILWDGSAEECDAVGKTTPSISNVVTAAGGNMSVGGFVGSINGSTTTRCNVRETTSNIHSGDNVSLGGFAGNSYNTARITNSFAISSFNDVTGSTVYIGGFISSNSQNSNVSNCYAVNTTAIATDAANNVFVSGFADTNQAGCAIESCYWYGTQAEGVSTANGTIDLIQLTDAQITSTDKIGGSGIYKDSTLVEALNAKSHTDLGFSAWTCDTANAYLNGYPFHGSYITYDYNGGGVTQKYAVRSNSLLIEPAAPTKAGFNFTGWFKDAGLTTKWNFATDLVSEDTVLYAGWSGTVVPPVPGGGGGGGSGPSTDAELPVLSDGKATRTSLFAATIAFTSNVSGSYTYIVVPAGSAEPKASDFGKEQSLSKGSNTLSVSGLIGKYAVDLYVKGKNTSGKEGAAVKIAIPEYVKEGSSADIVTQFNDVKDSWAKLYMQLLYNYGIREGYPDHTMRPDADISRAETAVILARALGLPENPTITMKFSDTADIPSWALASVQACVDKGIFVGNPDNKICATDPVTRNEIAVILQRAFAVNVPGAALSFTDSIPSWASDAVSRLVAKNVITGYPDHTFKGEKNVSNGEFDKTICVLLGLA